VHQSGSGWSPIYIEDNLALMSVGFLLPRYRYHFITAHQYFSLLIYVRIFNVYQRPIFRITMFGCSIWRTNLLMWLSWKFLDHY